MSPLENLNSLKKISEVRGPKDLIDIGFCNDGMKVELSHIVNIFFIIQIVLKHTIILNKELKIK